MPWWGWIVVGAVLLIAEVVIGTDFWLVFFGAAALCVGFLGAAGLALPGWAQWLIFGAFSILMLLLFRTRLRDRFRRGAGITGSAPPDLLGETGVAKDAIAPGARGRAEVRGAVWSVRNAGAAAIASGDRLKVESVEGLTLDVRRED